MASKKIKNKKAKSVVEKAPAGEASSHLKLVRDNVPTQPAPAPRPFQSATARLLQQLADQIDCDVEFIRNL